MDLFSDLPVWFLAVGLIDVAFCVKLALDGHGCVLPGVLGSIGVMMIVGAWAQAFG